MIEASVLPEVKRIRKSMARWRAMGQVHFFPLISFRAQVTQVDKVAQLLLSLPLPAPSDIRESSIAPLRLDRMTLASRFLIRIYTPYYTLITQQ